MVSLFNDNYIREGMHQCLEKCKLTGHTQVYTCHPPMRVSHYSGKGPDHWQYRSVTQSVLAGRAASYKVYN